MTTSVRSTASYWADSAPLPEFAPLDRNLHVDVVVVGGGITGLTAAYLLTREKLTVAVVERRRCAEVDTACTSAHLTAVTDARLSDLVATFGEDHARATWDAGLAAIATIEEAVRTLDVDCGFAWVPGYLHSDAFVRPAEEDAQILRREADAANRLGFDAHFVEHLPFVERAAVEFPGQARFHPRKYLAALAKAVVDQGGLIFEQSAADEVTDDPVAVVSRGHKITCRNIVIATHNPIVGNASLVSATALQTKLSLYSTYVVGGRVPHGSVPDGLYWDLGDPYRYLRIDPQPAFDYVLLGGEDHKTGQEPDPEGCYVRLEKALRPMCPDVEIVHRWSGQVIETNDGLPYIGEMAPGQFAATGFSGNGMTFGTLGAMMAADAITGRKNPWVGLFDLGRTTIRGGLWDYLKENKDYPYYMIRDRFAGPETRSLRAIPRGTGRIADIDGTRVAAYRADDGAITVLSPTCPHMGCHVDWNSAERTWDCPCHGSRFLPKGDVLSGPAESPLEKVDLKS